MCQILFPHRSIRRCQLGLLHCIKNFQSWHLWFILQVANILYNFRVLSTDANKNFSALWGKLAAEILAEKWPEANDDLNLLMEYIDGKK